MSRIPLRRLILVLVCLALAMVLGWRGARLSMRAADASSGRSDGAAVEVRERMGADTDEAGSENASGESLADQGETHLQAEVDELGGDAPSEDGEPSGAFVLPDEVEYESDVVLVGLADGVTAADLEALLSETDEIATKKVAADDVASGVVTLEVAEGYSVEDAVNALLGNELIDVVQPNYVYHAMLDEGDLYEVLADANEPQVETLEPIAVGAAEEDGPQPEQTADEAPAVSEDMGKSEVDDESAESDEEPAEGAPDHEEATEEEPAQSEAEAAIEEKAEEAPTLQALLDVNDPYSSSTSTNQWALSSIKAYGAWSIARCEGTVTVAVLDQLPDAAHEDLVGNVIATYDAHDTSVSPTITNPKNHGTHVAGIVSAVANNATGVAGVSYNAGLLLVNVFSSKLQSSTKDLINAYAWVMDRAQSDNVRVINLSLGGPVSDSYSFTDDLFLRSVEKARAEYGIVTVAAAANADSNKGVVPFREYPGDADNVVSVINLQRSGTDVTRNSTSNYNVSGQTGKNISAPGTDVWSTVPNGSYSTMSGTSMASPQVAGVLALEFAANNNLTADQAVSILYSSAVDLGDAGWDETYGYGEVNALEAVIAASSHLEGAMVTLEQDAYIYDGTAHEPAVTVTMDDVPLTEGVDYSVAYANNVSAGTGTVTITGKGEYKGFASASFTILPAEIVDADVVLATSSAVYTGKAIRPGLSVTVGGATLLAGTDYTISYQNNVAVGTAQVTVTGKGNYAGSASAKFSIVAAPSVSYRTHVQNEGWQAWKANGAIAGTSGKSLRLEGIQIKLGGSVGYSGSIQYRTHIQNVGWESSWSSDGLMSGTSGRSLRLEAIQIRLAGEVAKHYDVYYCVHAQNVGWLGWAKNGESAGTAGYAYRLEAIEISLVEKGAAAPGPTNEAFRAKAVSYRTHVQNDGWQGFVYDGAISGTSGRSLRLEGIEIRVGDLGYSGSVSYRTHVQNIGWQGWKSNGAMSGTSGRSLRLEAIEIKLSGELAQRYDIYYRVHAQNLGWMGWAKNGASAGTAGYSYRLEAIQIVLVPKGGSASGSTSNCFRQK